LERAGKIPTLFTAAVVMVALGFACANLLRVRRAADAGPAQSAS
jgi:hypothetical protein